MAGVAMGTYLRPKTIEEALAALAGGQQTVLAGATDVYPAWVGRIPEGNFLDIAGLPALAGIEETGEGWRIGAATTWSEIAAADLPALFAGLRRAACEVGGAQIQNAATVGGNLCNASPAADGAPALLALDASVDLASAGGERRLPLAEFLIGNRRTERRADELLTAIRIPRPRHETRSVFLKLGARRYLVISIVMVAATIEVAAGHVAGARIAVGACAPVAMRLPELEAALIGQPLGAGLGAVAMPAHLSALVPIDDVRASAAYRRDAALILVRRALSELGGA